MELSLRLRRAGILAATLGVLIGVWWFVWIPNWRPSLQDGERYGIDVSSHQGEVDWERVALDNIDFVYVKSTEGGDFVDASFERNWRGANAVGIDRGAYHFFTLCRSRVEQAENFLNVARPTIHALAPAVDLELAGNCSDRPSPREVNQELDAFVARVEKAWGRKVILYLGNDWEALYPTCDRLERPLWLRRFLLRPDGDWSIWQLHGYAHVKGVAGDADLDVMRTKSSSP